MRRTIHTGKTLVVFRTALPTLLAVAQPQLRRCSSAASAVAVLALFVFVALSPKVASAAENLSVSIANDGSVTLLAPPLVGDPIPTGSSGTFSTRIFRGSYPDRSTPTTGTGETCSGLNAGRQGQSWANFIENDLEAGMRVQATTTGKYWQAICQNPSADSPVGSVVDYWFPFYFNGTNYSSSETPEVPDSLGADVYLGTFNTRLITASSSGSRLTPNIGLQYYLDPTEFTFQNTPDSISINIWKDSTQDTLIGTDTPIILSYVSGTSTRNFIFSKALDANSTYRVNITFYNRMTNTVVFSRTSISMTIVTDGSNVISSTVNKVTDGLTFPDTQYEECGFFAFSGCLNNSFRFLFIPDTETVSQFSDTYDSLWEKAPFIYLSQIPDIIDTLFNQSGGTFSIGIDTGLGEFTFFNASQVAAVPNATTIKNIGAAFLWITFAFMLYRKTLAIHDNTTHV